MSALTLANERGGGSLAAGAVVSLVLLLVGLATLIFRSRMNDMLYSVTRLKAFDLRTPGGRFNSAVQFLIAPILLIAAGTAGLIWSLALLID